MKMKITQTIDGKHISDLLCSALEGGSNYWYQIEEKREPPVWEFDSEPKPTKGHWAQDYPLNIGGALIISDMEDEEHGKMKLDLEAIKKGLEKMSEAYPAHFADFVGENHDATTADVFLQCCLFGEVIYG